MSRMRSMGWSIALATSLPVAVLVALYCAGIDVERSAEIDRRARARAQTLAERALTRWSAVSPDAVAAESMVRERPELHSVEFRDALGQPITSFHRAQWRSERPDVVEAKAYDDAGSVEVSVRRSAITREVAASSGPTFWILFSLPFVVFAVAFSWGRRRSRFISRLSALSGRLAAGTLTARGPVGRDELGQLGRSINSMADQISEHQEEFLQMRNLALDAANRAREAAQVKTEFLAEISHEIRTPMTAVLGYADLLLAECDAENPLRRHATVIHSNAEHLLSVIDDTLDFAKIEAGRLEIEKLPTDPAVIVRDVVTLLGPKARENGTELEMEFPEPIARQVDTDPTRLRQILMNLVGNAIKFTERGSVRVATRMIEGGEQRFALAFQVIDTGVGMTDVQVSGLFQKFGQADASITRRFGGTGLGLTISRTLSEALGGGIHVESELGRGSVFTVVIDPGAVVAEAFEQPDVGELERMALEAGTSSEAASDETGRRLLIVDDNHDIRELVSSVARRRGFEVTTATCGEDAQGRVEAALAGGAPIDGVITDLRMPGMDGIEMSRVLRELGFRGRILLLSASTLEEREEALSAGCDAHFPKPFRPPELGRYIEVLFAEESEVEVVCRAESADDETESASRERAALEEELTSPDNSSGGRGTSLPDGIEARDVRSLFSEDPEMEECIEFFLERLPERIERLREFDVEAEIGELENLAHDIKGIAGTVGFPELSRRAAAMEAAAEALPPNLEVLESSVAHFLRLAACVVEAAKPAAQ
ncbi:MAG: ATP-binding protein [Planctomycetota bacterium]